MGHCNFRQSRYHPSRRPLAQSAGICQVPTDTRGPHPPGTWHLAPGQPAMPLFFFFGRPWRTSACHRRAGIQCSGRAATDQPLAGLLSGPGTQDIPIDAHCASRCSQFNNTTCATWRYLQDGTNIAHCTCTTSCWHRRRDAKDVAACVRRDAPTVDQQCHQSTPCRLSACRNHGMAAHAVLAFPHFPISSSLPRHACFCPAASKYIMPRR